MTLDKFLELPAAELKAMTTPQLHEYFGPFLSITRPDRVVKTVDAAVKPKTSSAVREKTAQVNDMLAGLGIDLKI